MKSPTVLRALYVLAIVLFVAVWLDVLWCASVDLALHYSLTFRIADELQLPPANDPSLQVMSLYPALSHLLAVVFGKLLGSPLLGIQVVTLVSIALAWLAFLSLVASLPGRSGLVAALVLAGTAYANWVWLGLPIHGTEVVGNFFYSHLVVQAVVCIGMALAVRLEVLGQPWIARALLLPLIGLSPSIHLLGALELLGILCVVLASGFLTGEYAQRPRRMAAAAAMLLVAVGVTVLHPAFAVMLRISGNNGAAGLGALDAIPLNSMLVHVLLCGLVLALCFGLFVAWRRRGYSQAYAGLRYAMAYGISIAGLCLVQLAATRMGFGSEYAVKKYGFALVSFLFLAVAIFAGLAMERAGPGRRPEWWAAARPVTLLLAFCVLLAGVRGPKGFDVSDIVSAERQVMILRDTVLDPRGTHAVVQIGLPSIVPYLLSIGVLKAPLDKALDVLNKDSVSGASGFGQVIVGSGSPLFHSKDCPPVFSGGGLSVIQAGCIEAAMAGAMRERMSPGTHRIGIGGDGTMLLGTGWSFPEAWGMWSDGPVAIINLPCLQERSSGTDKLALTLRLHSFGVQPMSVLQDGKVLWEGTVREPMDLPLVVNPRRCDGSDRLELRLPNAESPQARGTGPDTRRLGVGLLSISVH